MREAYPTDAMIEAAVDVLMKRMEDVYHDLNQTVVMRKEWVAEAFVAAERAAWVAGGDLRADRGHVLVQLPKHMLGSQMQVARTGKLPLIGGQFAFDIPKQPTHVRPLPLGPEGEQP